MARPRRQPVLATLLAALTLSACTSSPVRPVALPSPVAAPTASVSSASAEDLAKQAAKATIEKYWATYTKCFADPSSTRSSCFDEVAIGSDLAELKTSLLTAQQMRSRAFGEIALVSLDLVSVDLTSKLTERPPVVPTVTFRACVDVSQFLILDKDGHSIVPVGRAPRSLADVAVVNYKYPDRAQWRVGFQIDRSTKC